MQKWQELCIPVLQGNQIQQAQAPSRCHPHRSHKPTKCRTKILVLFHLYSTITATEAWKRLDEYIYVRIYMKHKR